MTEQKGFKSAIEAQVTDEADRIINQLNFLRAQASEVLAVMRALNLPTPEALRNLDPIEQVPKIEVKAPYKTPIIVEPDHPEHPVQDTIKSTKGRTLTRTPKLEARVKRQRDKAEKKYQSIRAILLEMLAKGPRMKADIYKDITEYSDHAVTDTFTRMKKNNEINTRTIGYQGNAEWFLPSRPVTIEQVRDASLKVRIKKSGFVSSNRVAEELGIEQVIAKEYLMELVNQGILGLDEAGFTYVKPTGPPINRPKVKEELPKVLNGRGKHVSGTGRKNKISSDKEVQQIIAKAEAMGAQVKKQGNNHIYVEYKGQHRILSATPGDSNRSNREKLKDLGISV